MAGTGLEELISRCEFENKQYVRAVNQEDQLSKSLQNEIEIKRFEMERLQSAMEQMDKDTQRYDRQFTHNRDNIGNLKKTSDVLTDHVHAMKTKFETIKIKGQEEKNSHDEQLQHFKDTWMKYKEKYESFPLALKLKKLRTQIQDVQDRTENCIENTKKMKEAIGQLENSQFWKSMDLKTFIIKVAENRVETMTLQKEIDKKKEEMSAFTTGSSAQGVEMDLHADDSSEENNLQRLSQMQIREEDQQERDYMMDMDTCSPLISVLSEREEDYVEMMQTDQPHDAASKENVESMEHSNQQYQQASSVTPALEHKVSHQHVLASLQSFLPTVEDKASHHNVPASSPGYPPTPPKRETPQYKERTNKESMMPSPYVSYKKVGQTDGSCKERVNLHLNMPHNQLALPNPNKSLNNMSSNAGNQQHATRPKYQWSLKEVKDTSFICPRVPTISQKSVPASVQNRHTVPNPRLNCRMPFNLVQAPAASQTNSPRVVSTPSLPQSSAQRSTLQQGASTRTSQSPNKQPPMLIQSTPQRSMPQGTYMRASQSPRIQPPPMPLMMNKFPKPKPVDIASAKVPKLSCSVPTPSQSSLTSRPTPVMPRPEQSSLSSRPTPVMPRPEQQLKKPKAAPSENHRQEFTKPEMVQSKRRISAKPTEAVCGPEMLKAQTSKMVKSLRPQPSPLPPVQQSPTNTVPDKPSTSETDESAPRPDQQDFTTQSPHKMTNDVSSSKSLLPQGHVYYEPLKDSPEKSSVCDNKKVESPQYPPAPELLNKMSPFNFEKHRKVLEELKKSPGSEYNFLGRRMFETETSSKNTAAMFGGGDHNVADSDTQSPVYTSVFGGAKQPAGDNMYTATPLESSAAKGNLDFFSFSKSSDIGQSSNRFMMFGEGTEDQPGAHGDRFSFNLGGGGQDSVKSPAGALSLFDTPGREASSPQHFSFNLQKDGSPCDESPGNNLLSLFGDSSGDQDTGASSSFSFSLHGHESRNEDDGGNVLSMFGDNSGTQREDESSNKGFSFNLGEEESGRGDEGIFSLFGGSADTKEDDKPFSFGFN